MGKFSGVLLASDFDNTLLYTEDTLKGLCPMPGLLPENRRAIAYFMAQGGIFSVATGRAKPSFEEVRHITPMNGPTILFNGAAIYDFAQERYLHTAFLPECVRPCIDQVLRDWPEAAAELYHDDNSIHALQANELTERHAHLTHTATVALASIDQVPSPISKALFELMPHRLTALLAYIRRQSWADDYEIVPSSPYLLELTAKGASKGGMVSALAEMLGIAREHIYCVGDHANDVSMLHVSAVPFAPANAIEQVRSLPGLHLLPDARCGAIAALIDYLDTLY